MEYGVLITLHLFCAILFIGIVAFEVIFLENIRRYLPTGMMALVEEGIHRRARKIMPYVVGLLFLTGIGLLVRVYWSGWYPPFSSLFSTLLSVKIVLALSVLVHFITAIRASVCGSMNSRRFKITHYSVFVHMVLIVVLAKAMFYLT
ncbi:CopD family copper resistance protein [Alloalcanivorax xenomutans]|uniref:CopD family copper resistance protein n=1 Tax=Alloalcanivorax xenomutans TaxID=1094342 RepID=UPI003BABDEE8